MDDHFIDIALAKSAAKIAMERHAGRLEQIYTPNGEVIIKRGKDLTDIKTVIGVGGIFAYGHNNKEVLEGMLFQQTDPLSLKPKKPSFYIDKSYILYAIGLLAEIDPAKAFNVGINHLEKLIQ